MQNVIERLRTSLEEAAKIEFDQGFEAGKDWAMHSAEAPQLRRLADFEEACSPEDWNLAFTETDFSAYSACENLYFLIEPKYDGCRMSANGFWYFRASEGVDLTGSYCQGFAEGALEVWRECEPQL